MRERAADSQQPNLYGQIVEERARYGAGELEPERLRLFEPEGRQIAGQQDLFNPDAESGERGHHAQQHPERNAAAFG